MSIDHYNLTRTGDHLPRHTTAARLTVADTIDAHRDGVDALHAAERAGILLTEQESGISLLDLKIEIADRMLDACDLCPHHCLVDRNHGAYGYCGVDNNSSVHWEGILSGEERELIPSHEVFFSGCTMRCAFCYSHEHITKPMSGEVQTPDALGDRIRRRLSEGAISLNLVGGEPTVHIPNILKSLRQANVKVPVIWNSNMYITPPAMEILDGIVDLYLGDIHFGNDRCAAQLGRIPNYLPSITTSFQMAVDSGAGVIIRHLVVPGHLECCTRPSLEWAKAHFPGTLFHLMFQYVPDYRAVGDPQIGRPLNRSEMDKATKMAQEIGVLLYEHDRSINLGSGPREMTGPPAALATPAPSPFQGEGWGEVSSGQGDSIGDSVDILVHADGRIAFTRLLEKLTPVARALESASIAAVEQ